MPQQKGNEPERIEPTPDGRVGCELKPLKIDSQTVMLIIGLSL